MTVDSYFLRYRKRHQAVDEFQTWPEIFHAVSGKSIDDDDDMRGFMEENDW